MSSMNDFSLFSLEFHRCRKLSLTFFRTLSNLVMFGFADFLYPLSTLYFPALSLKVQSKLPPPPISPSSILVPPVLIGFPATSFHVDAPQPHWCFMLNSGSVQLFLRPPRLMTAFHFYAKTKRCLFTAIVYFRPLIPAPPPPPTTRQLPLKWLLFTLQAFSLPVCGQSYSWH